ncbi:hypothetical protein I5907_01295 [Panacibacter sp. DH6]|uniref:Long-chain fatty acid transport protein n=1 Tax=Panacibacter microcysteis TaxID=2793269 RepID=A0A931E475_9BACT|nr:hypothetical protein [Panacibacter microcysteis]MBG9374854.1 hypothetical protein [Panacibacter microcysteis]
MQKIFIMALFVLCIKDAGAQNTSSPYSVIGIGDIQQSSFDRSSGMANTGIGLSSGRYLYHANPASYGKLEPHYFTMEVALRYKNVSYSGNGVSAGNNTSDDLSVEKLVIAHKIKDWWGASIGLMPYSTSNYAFYSTKDVQGTNLAATTYYEGSGGFNQAYIGNGFAIAKNLRAGVQATILFGNFTQEETLYTNLIGITTSPVVTTTKIYSSKVLFKGGLQYDLAINKHWALNIGAVASQQSKLNANYNIEVTDDESTISAKETYKANYFTLPSAYGGGIALVKDNKITFAADYQRQLWSNFNYKGFNYELRNSDRMSVGFEYKKRTPYMNGYVEKYFLQAGAFYNNSYLHAYGRQLKDYGLSFGAGFNARRSQFGYMLNLELGRRGTTASNLIQENYVQFGVTFSYRDLWLTKVKRYND